MSLDTDMKRIQRKTYISYFQDGLWDVLLGLFFLMWGLMMLADIASMVGVEFVILSVMRTVIIVALFLYPAIWAVKKWAAYSRIGYVKLRKAEEQKIGARLTATVVIAVLLGVLMLLLVYSGGVPQWFDSYFIVCFGGILAAAVGLIAYWLKVNHWYAYAVLIFSAFALQPWLQTPLHYSFIASGSIVLLSGLVLLIRFICKYPKPAEEGFDED